MGELEDMKTQKNRLMALCLTVILVAGTLTGCKNTKVVVTTGLASNELFRIGDVSCMMPEALVYLNNQKNQYENIYGIEMWEHDFGDITLGEYLKSQVLSQLGQMKSMVYLAEQREITLPEEDQQKAQRAAAEYFASLDETEVKKLGVDEASIQKMYEDYCLAQEAYNRITEDVAVEVSDDEARIIELDQIFVEEETLAQELKSRLDNGEDFETLAANYSKASKVTVNVARGEKSQEYEDVAFDLDNEEISDVFAADGGYYILKCLNTYLPDESEANKEKVARQEKQTRFQAIYDELMADTISEYQERLWEKTDLTDYEDVKTNTFFKVYESYFGDGE